MFRLQFDEFQIVSSSHDDIILIWDFLNYSQKNADSSGSRNVTNSSIAINNGDASVVARSPSRKLSRKKKSEIQV